MSAFREIVIECDESDCFDQVAFQCVEFKTARADAHTVGWTYVNGLDYCPSCSQKRSVDATSKEAISSHERR